MKEKEYVCAYKHCLHHGEKVKASEAVMLSNKRYHMDCAALKQEIQYCVSAYMEYKEDKTEYPIASRIINTLVFKNNVPVEYIKNKIEASKKYYSERPVQALYGIRKFFWEKEIKA